MSNSPANSRSANRSSSALSSSGASRMDGATNGSPPCLRMSSAISTARRLSSARTRNPWNGTSELYLGTHGAVVPRYIDWDRIEEIGGDDVSEPSTAPRANPAPLGLAGFGLTTVVLSSINAGLLTGDSPGLVAVVVPLAFAYGGVAQIITGILEFKNGNTFGIVAFTSYGLFWWWYAFLFWTVGAGWIKPPAPAGVGITLLMWGVFTLYMWISTFRSNLAVWTVFLLLWITFFLL